MSLDAKVQETAKEKKLSYFRQIQQELKKVTWTSKEELILSTKIVLVSTILFSFAIYFTDLILHYIFNSINNIARLIIG